MFSAKKERNLDLKKSGNINPSGSESRAKVACLVITVCLFIGSTPLSALVYHVVALCNAQRALSAINYLLSGPDENVAYMLFVH